MKLQFWDYGQDGNPPLVLVHGGLDHARSWDWVARSLCAEYHVYAYDLRGHGNSAWAPGAMYSMAENVLDLAGLLDIVASLHGRAPLRLVGHSLGGMIVLHYAGLYPDRVGHAVSIEGLGFPPGHRIHGSASVRLRRWIGAVRDVETRSAKAYPNPDAAVARMREANPRLSDDVARHLTLHGTNWNADASLTWKFDNYLRALAPYGHEIGEAAEIFSEITCPALLFWGLESFAPLPQGDPRFEAIRNRRLITVPNAGHWLHHDQRELFVRETAAFLKS
ncbi:MAG: alpha/beta hydrolase [Acidobacteriota bacterium]